MIDTQLLVRAGELAIIAQKEDGSMPAGRNGPHNHQMTCTRNTSHFSILFSFLYKLTRDEKWKKSAFKCLEYVMNQRPLGGSYWHRIEDCKTSYNGLIGQAWTFEALIYATRVFDDPVFLNDAKEVVRLHSFDKYLGLWHELSLDGRKRDICSTLNQQIWFMAMAFLAFREDNIMNDIVNIFLDKLSSHIKLRYNGLLFGQTFNYHKSHNLLRNLISYRNSYFSNILKDNAYLVFTLLGLSYLYPYFSHHTFFSSRLFKNILFFPFSNTYSKYIYSSPFAFPYNVPGFELPYVSIVFHSFLSSIHTSFSADAYNFQITNYFCSETNGLLSNNSDDVETLAARIYEGCRLHELWEV